MDVGRVKYGRLLTSDEINAALQHADPYSALGYSPPQGAHGTHVVDIAAGNGRGTGQAGIAPQGYSDDQLYALALYLYSLRPPPNPNKFDQGAGRGKKVFERAGCAGCHTPPLYTNNKLTLAEGFTLTNDERSLYDIMPVPVGTDSALALMSRRGTGFYKVPSLKGVWYRGMFGHNGWCATLEDWFDPNRVKSGYVPTGFKPHGAETFAVKGHVFGLDLSADDRKALIAFLKTL